MWVVVVLTKPVSIGMLLWSTGRLWRVCGHVCSCMYVVVVVVLLVYSSSIISVRTRMHSCTKPLFMDKNKTQISKVRHRGHADCAVRVDYAVGLVSSTN